MNSTSKHRNEGNARYDGKRRRGSNRWTDGNQGGESGRHNGGNRRSGGSRRADASRREGGVRDAEENRRKSGQGMRPAPTPTTTLDVVDYTVTRAIELRALREAAIAVSGSKRVYQQLSWHARRRTMSHSSHRMPARLRAAHIAQLQKQNAVKPPGVQPRMRLRKYRKKARFLAAIRRLRAKNPRWLETHIWHAKRFRMGVLGGRCVAEACNDRGYRSAYRAVTRACVAHDASYNVILQLAAESKQLLKQNLHAHLSFEDARRATTDPVTNGSRRATNLVLLKDGRAIGPFDLLWRPTAPTAWLFVHPELASAVESAFSGSDISVDRLQNPPVCFALLGPRTGPVLAAIFSSESKALSYITRTRDARCLPPGSVFADTTPDPRASFPPKTVGRHVLNIGVHDGDVGEAFRCVQDSALWEESTRADWLEKGTVMCNKEAPERVPFMLLHRDAFPGWDIVLPSGWGMPFWVSLMYANNTRAVGTDEMRLLRLENGLSVFPEDFPDSRDAGRLLREEEQGLLAAHLRRPKAKRVNYIMNRITSPMFPALSDVADREIACLGRVHLDKRLKLNNDGSNGKNQEVATAEVEAHTDATVKVARGRAGLGGMLTGCSVSLMGSARQGPQRKRHTAPATPQMEGDSTEEHCTTFARVSIVVPGKGVPEKNAILCEPTLSDLDMIQKQGKSYAGFREERVRDVEAGAEPTRPVVGYVSLGGYALTKGCGVGSGFAAISALRKMAATQQRNGNRRNGVWVLFRNAASPHYRAGSLRVVDG